MNTTRTGHCDKDALLLYYYGELSEQQQQALTGHLEVCDVCAGEWRELQQTLDAVARPVIVLGTLERRKFAARVAEKAERRTQRRFWMWGGALAAGMVLVASLMVPLKTGPGYGNGLGTDVTLARDLDLLQHLELLQELELLQSLEGQG